MDSRLIRDSVEQRVGSMLRWRLVIMQLCKCRTKSVDAFVDDGLTVGMLMGRQRTTGTTAIRRLIVWTGAYT